MRWEMLSTRIQESDGTDNPRKQVEALLIRIFTAMLRFYPVSFRTDFADEMLDVFGMTLRESSGQMEQINIMFREIILFPLSLIAAYRTAFNQLPPGLQRRYHIRLIVRLSGAVLAGFLLMTLSAIFSPSYHLYSAAIPFAVALLVATMSLLLGVFWARAGGILTLCSGTALGCCMTLYVYVMGLDEVGIVGTVLIGLLWAMPFLIFGILFYELSFPPKQPSIPA